MCCGESYQQKSRYVAIFLIAGYTLLSILSGVGLFHDYLGPGIHYAQGLFITTFVVGILSLLISILLYTGVEKGNLIFCKIWFYWTIFLIVYDIGGLIFELVNYKGILLGSLAQFIVQLVIIVYFLNIVSVYMGELEGGGFERNQNDV